MLWFEFIYYVFKTNISAKFFIENKKHVLIKKPFASNTAEARKLKNISEKNSTLDASETLITEKDTNLLGRKLFSAYRTVPNKVENVGALIDGKTNEAKLTFLYEKPNKKEKKGKYKNGEKVGIWKTFYKNLD